MPVGSPARHGGCSAHCVGSRPGPVAPPCPARVAHADERPDPPVWSGSSAALRPGRAAPSASPPPHPRPRWPLNRSAARGLPRGPPPELPANTATARKMLNRKAVTSEHAFLETVTVASLGGGRAWDAFGEEVTASVFKVKSPNTAAAGVAGPEPAGKSRSWSALKGFAQLVASNTEAPRGRLWLETWREGGRNRHLKNFLERKTRLGRFCAGLLVVQNRTHARVTF